MAHLIRLAVLCGFIYLLSTHTTAQSEPHRIPVLTYHSWAVSGCTYATNNLLALEHDLQMLHDLGWTAVPLYWIAQWVVTGTPADALPERAVGISFDDGDDLNWLTRVHPEHECTADKSVRSIVEQFRVDNPDVPWYAPHVSLFVIASRTMRQNLDADRFNDNWWGEANKHPNFEIYNHTTDHDHDSITDVLYDPEMNLDLPVAALADGRTRGEMNPRRITNYASADAWIAAAAERIHRHIQPAWPDLLAYPMGVTSTYLRTEYLPNYRHEHNTYAAFCTGPQYVTRQSDRWCLPRFTMGADWHTPEQLQVIMEGALVR